MKKLYLYISIILFLSSITYMIGRSFRVSQMPYGSKYSCDACHKNGGGSARNPFGLDVESLVTPNGHETFWGPELAALDSDGDGFTNGEELQDPNGLWTEGSANPGDPTLVTHPGSPDDFPTSVDDLNNSPIEFALHSNYPNPFNPSTTIKYSIPVADAYNASTTNVTLNIYDILGREVETLVNEKQSPGNYEVVFNAANLTSGTYFYRLISGNNVKTMKMILLK